MVGDSPANRGTPDTPLDRVGREPFVEFEFVDAHVHLHRDAEMERRSLPLPGRRDRDRWGNADAIVPYLDREGGSHAVALNLFPTPVMRRALRSKISPTLSNQQRAAEEEAIEVELVNRLRRHNEWLCGVSQAQPRIVAGIGIQKLLSADEMVEEVEVRVASGARAVKLVPGWFRESPHDRQFWPMYERCQELGIPIVSDTGTLGLGHHRAYPGEVNDICYGEPLAFEDVLKSFPRLTVVMAHFASAYWDQRQELALRYQNVMFDISGGFGAHAMEVRDGSRALHEDDAVRVLRRVGIERFMFGSDGPSHMVQPAIEQVIRLGLSDDELKLVLSDNARRIYSIAG
jgi:predicted TIM-barrel fold metal-dependent hydrolase